MAASYFGKFENQSEAQMALDHGQLLKPFVAMWEDQVHYDDLDETAAGEVIDNTTGLPLEAITATSVSTDVYTSVFGDLYWSVTVGDYDWIQPNTWEGYGADTIIVQISQNPDESARASYIKYSFYYDYERQNLRNEVMVPVSQEAAQPLSPGVVSPTYTGITNSDSDILFDITADNLYWKVEPADPNSWCPISMQWGSGSGQGMLILSPGYNAWVQRGDSAVFSFYRDGSYTSLLNTVTVSFDQAGSEAFTVSMNDSIFEDVAYVEYVSGSTDAHVINIPENGYYDVSVNGQPLFSNVTADTVSISFEENRTPRQRQTSYLFQSSNGDSQYVHIHQDGNYSAPMMQFDNTSEVLSSGRQGSIEIINNGGGDAWDYFVLDAGDANFLLSFDGQSWDTAVTGSTGNTTVYYQIGANTAASESIYMVYLTCYDGLDAEVYQDRVQINQFGDGELEGLVQFNLTFESTEDNQEMQIIGVNGYSRFRAITIDGGDNYLDSIKDNGGKWTFDSADTHSVVCYKGDWTGEINDNQWFGSSEMKGFDVFPVKAEGNTGLTLSFQGGWTGILFQCQNLESVFLPDYFQGVFGSMTFTGCQNLNYIECWCATDPLEQGASNLWGISQTGELHIPVGADYSNLAAFLGAGWTVIDDLGGE